MRSWLILSGAVLFLGAAFGWYSSVPEPQGVAENPMAYASDEWVVWRSMDRRMATATLVELLPTLDTGRVPQSEVFRSFTHESLPGLLWHHEAPWAESPATWQQVPWRGGWLSGSKEVLGAWEERPGQMAMHWREGEPFASLHRGEWGWSWGADGWVVWADSAAVQAEGVPRGMWVPAGGQLSWWAGHRNDVPATWTSRLSDSMEEQLVDLGVPLNGWGVRWPGGGRWQCEDSAGWTGPIRALATQHGWDCSWEGMDLVMQSQGAPLVSWKPSEAMLLASQERTQWVGKGLREGVTVWHPLSTSDAEALPVAGVPQTIDVGPTMLGEVRNHRTRGVMQVVETESGVGAFDAQGDKVWEVACGTLLQGGAKEVDVYNNGKYQTMFGASDALHLIDVKGREVSGFPIRGSWTAWALVDYDANGKSRYLLGSARSGLIENRRGEGAKTPGWKHRADVSIDVDSPIEHIEHLRIGARDYIYVGRANGQVELLKRNGQTRALTPVTVKTGLPPCFRIGADLDGTSVLFVDATGWVREFTLGQGEEVGLSGTVRADRLEVRDVDGDGLDEVVTWLQGLRTVWNARNEPMAL